MVIERSLTLRRRVSTVDVSEQEKYSWLHFGSLSANESSALAADLEIKSVREGKVVNADVSKQGVAHCLAAVFPEPTDEEKCDYVKVPVFLPFSDLAQMICVPKKKNIHSEALLKPVNHDAMALISELIAMKMRKVVWLLTEGRKRPCWGAMMAILSIIKCVVVDKAKFAMDISLDPIETEFSGGPD